MDSHTLVWPLDPWFKVYRVSPPPPPLLAASARASLSLPATALPPYSQAELVSQSHNTLVFSGRLVRAAATSVSGHCHGMLWLQIDSITYLSGLNLLPCDLRGAMGWVGGSV